MKSAKTKSLKILLIGIGNDSRGDDGLGWLFLDALEKEFGDILDFEYKFQLQVEDAEMLKRYDVVFFADASEKHYSNGFLIEPCKAAGEYYYSSHLQSPETVLYLTHTLYGAYPDAFLITISGNSWELGEKPGRDAIRNLNLALDEFSRSWLPKYILQKNNQKKGKTHVC